MDSGRGENGISEMQGKWEEKTLERRVHEIGEEDGMGGGKSKGFEMGK